MILAGSSIARRLTGDRVARVFRSAQTPARKSFSMWCATGRTQTVFSCRINRIGAGFRAGGYTDDEIAIYRRTEGALGRDELTMLILLIVLLLVFGGGGGYYGHSRWGAGGGAGVGFGTILVILLIVYLMGGLR